MAMISNDSEEKNMELCVILSERLSGVNSCSQQGLSVPTDFLRPGDRGRPEEASSDSLSAASRSEEPSAQAPACGAAASRSHTPPDSVQKIIKKCFHTCHGID